MGPEKNRSGELGGYTSKILRVNLSDGRVSTLKRIKYPGSVGCFQEALSDNICP
jgi:hypothetical protein